MRWRRFFRRRRKDAELQEEIRPSGEVGMLPRFLICERFLASRRSVPMVLPAAHSPVKPKDVQKQCTIDEEQHSGSQCGV